MRWRLSFASSWFASQTPSRLYLTIAVLEMRFLSFCLNHGQTRRQIKNIRLWSWTRNILSFSQTNGIVNHLIEAVGGKRIGFLTEPKWFKTLYVFTGIWKNTGWNAIIYLAALAGVDQECIEAARVDGASRWKIMTRIRLPHIVPTMILLLILSTGNILSVGFEKVFLLQNDLNFEASTIIATYTYRVGLMGGEFSYSTAIGLFNSIVNVLVLLLVNSLSKHLTQNSLI